MPRYFVTMPVAGSASAEVEAESQEAALESLIDLFSSDPDAVEVTWEFYERLVEGNVCHAKPSRAYVEELDA